MKHFFTSYYAVCKESEVILPTGDVGQTFSISVKPPWWWQPKRHFAPLAPDQTIVRAYKQGKITDRQYTRLYIDQLNTNVDANKVVEQLPDNAVLLCYEKPEDFCHRHVAAWWITEHTGIQVSELEVQTKTRKQPRKPMTIDDLLEF